MLTRPSFEAFCEFLEDRFMIIFFLLGMAADERGACDSRHMHVYLSFDEEYFVHVDMQAHARARDSACVRWCVVCSVLTFCWSEPSSEPHASPPSILGTKQKIRPPTPTPPPQPLTLFPPSSPRLENWKIIMAGLLGCCFPIFFAAKSPTLGERNVL